MLRCVSVTAHSHQKLLGGASDLISEGELSLIASPGDAMTAVRQMAERRALWTGFRPTDIPVAIYDGSRTWLYSHPDPPDAFKPLSDGVSIHDGLHETVRANTACLVGDVWTATFMSLAQSGSIEEAASIVIHEMFHVFQISKHQNWWSNEADRFMYPVFDEEALCLRRLETRMLRAALSAAEGAESMRYAKAALGFRKTRYGLVGAKPAEYERGMERIEGLAQYIEDLSLGRTDPRIPDEEYSPDDVRRRCYAVGAAWARLLDRYADGWVAEFDRREDAPALDTTLDGKLGASTVPLDPAPHLVRAERVRAASDIDALQCRYRDMKDRFMSSPGARVVIESGDASPLRTVFTDPSNMTMLNATQVLHTRNLVLKAGSGSGEIEVLGVSALTESGGAHPLYDGIRCVTIAGLSETPTIIRESGCWKVWGAGITARLPRATVQSDDDGSVKVTIEP